MSLESLETEIKNYVATDENEPRLLMGWALIVAHEPVEDTGTTSYKLVTAGSQAAHVTLGLLASGVTFVEGEMRNDSR